MAVVWFDGFDFDTDLANAGYLSPSNVHLSSGGGRFGGNALQGDGFYTPYLNRPLPSPLQEIIVAIAYNQGQVNTGRPIFSVGDVSVSINTTDNSLTLSSPTFSVKTLAGSVPSNGWFHISLHVSLSTTATGFYRLYLNGNPTPTLTASGIATSGADSASSVVLGGGPGLQYNGAIYWDDLVILDTTGPAPFNDVLGDFKVVTYIPSAPGRVNDFTNVGGASNVASVSTVDGDASYTQSNTPGQTDAYALTIASGQTATGAPVAVSASAYVRKDDAGAREIAVGIGDGATEVVDQGVFLSASYAFVTRIFTSNPFTSAPWQQADIATLQAAVKVLA